MIICAPRWNGVWKKISKPFYAWFGIFQFLWACGHEAEGRQWASTVLEKSSAIPISKDEAGRRLKSLRAYAYQALAMVTYSQGDNAHAKIASENAAALASQVGNKRLIAMALGFGMFGRTIVGDTKDTEKSSEQALNAARESKDQFVLGMTLAMMGQRSLD